MISKRTARAIVFLVPMFCIGAPIAGYLFFAGDHPPMSKRIRQRKDAPIESGEKLIKVIEDYKVARASYPASLTDLVPGFIDVIPRPGWGLNEWRYSSDGKSYHLSVRRLEGRYESISHQSGGGIRWYHDN